MFVRYKINPFTLLSGSTASTINIPITLNYELVDNAELISTKFVPNEVQKSINPILDYEKVRFIPKNDLVLDTITYNLFFLKNGSLANPTMYSDIGFSNDDLKYETNYFTESYLLLNFYDSDNPLTQNLVNQVEIYSMLTPEDHYQNGFKTGNTYVIAGQTKPSNQVPVRFLLSNPLTQKKAFYEGYSLYYYKDELTDLIPKYLYMNATYYNTKTGISTNLITQPFAYTIDKLINFLYTRYILSRNTTGYYYTIDTAYSNNVNFNGSGGTVNLYQIQTL